MGILWLDLNLLHIITENVLRMLPAFRIGEESPSRKMSQHWGTLAVYCSVIIPIDIMSRHPVCDQVCYFTHGFHIKKMPTMIGKETS